MRRKPEWLKTRLPRESSYLNIKKILNEEKLHSVCVEAKCPNISKCWDSGTATFMILGDICTRSCKFCVVNTGNPMGYIDTSEPARLKNAVERMKLDYVVITSVDRDDLPDKGAGIFIETAKLLREYRNDIVIEILTPDFGGDSRLIEGVLKSGINVFAHNIEVVRSLSDKIRDNRADYDLSLEVLRMASKNKTNIVIKSGIMVGIGETEKEVLEAMSDVRKMGVKIFTIGQYLQPHKNNINVQKYIEPDTFEMFKREGEKIGLIVKSGPLVRSSFEAKQAYWEAKKQF
jgi:lipoic acid synthetase